jgi:glycerol-3-phosphate dehydrogenase (NAD(P)+)
MPQYHKIAVLGAGSWGTALALQLARNSQYPILWDRNTEILRQMSRQRQNVRYLPGIDLPETISCVHELFEAVSGVDAISVVVPSEGFRDVLQQIAGILNGEPSPPIVWATKGLDSKTAKFLHQVIEEELGAQTKKAILSGPSFAKEVALGLPTAVTVAADNLEFASQVASFFHGERFRVYTSDDIVGVELGGAIKNVLAIATGISDGLGFGANARAALITRGLSEIMRLGDSFDVQKKTLSGLSGLGDLVLTCTDDQSRNRRLGLAIGRGESMQSAIDMIGQAVEGAVTAKVVERLAEDRRVDMPIAEKVYRILYKGLDPHIAVTELLKRDLKVETL